MSESDTLALQCVGRILKPARLMAGKGMRQFAQEIGLLPSRISEIETGSAPTAAELKLMADALEAARREGIDWRESTVATLAARESELAAAQRRVAELEDMHRKIVDGIEWTMTNIGHDMRCATPETDPWYKSLKRVDDLLVAVRKALLQPDRITHIPGKESDDGEMH